MKRLYFWDESGIVDRCATLLEEGKVLLADSDTVPGLFTLATQEGALHLDTLKERRDKPYLILIGDKAAVAEYADIPNFEYVDRLMKGCWPGPLTVLLPATSEIKILTGTDTVALRVPHHHWLRQIAQRVGGIFSTSANKSGLLVPQLLTEVEDGIKQKVASIIAKPQAETIHNENASTIVNCTTEKPVIVRLGAYPKDELERVAGVKL